MQNPFLIARFVLFALLFHTSLLSLIFAAWNVQAMSDTAISLSATTILLVFTSSLSLICISLGLLELAFSRVKLSWVMFECIWSAVLSLFLIGSAISMTVTNATMNQEQSTYPGVSVSSALLTPVTWLTSFILLAYFVALFVTALAHRRAYPYVWSQSPYDVDWFAYAENDGSITAPSKRWSRCLDDTEDQASEKGKRAPSIASKAPWAQGKNVRRGIDSPFSPKAVTEAKLTTMPLRVQPKAPSQAKRSSFGSRFVEPFKESRILSRPESTSHFHSHHTTRVAPFPPTLPDHNLPIPLPRLSEWIRADAINGINVHTVPRSP